MIERNKKVPEFAGRSTIGRRTMLAALAGMACSPLARAAADHGFEVVHAFTPYEALIRNGSLVQTPDGRLHGTSLIGGRHLEGSVYRSTPRGRVKVVASFTERGELGSECHAPVCLGPDGQLYGANGAGGSGDSGTLFAIDEAGTATLVHAFTGPDGSRPETKPMAASDGLLYGTTSYGGANDIGVLYRITPGIGFAVLRSLQIARPSASLVEGADGYLYTVSEYGGTGNGSIVRYSRDGTVEDQVHVFAANYSEGALPAAPLLPMPDGSMVGTARMGGAGHGILGQGTIYRLGTDGALSVLHHFSGKRHDGVHPSGGVISDASGRLYGLTEEGGLGGGTVYRLDPDGSLKLLHRFVLDDYDGGFGPVDELLLAQDGRLYGTTYAGGGIFRLRTGG